MTLDMYGVKIGQNYTSSTNSKVTVIDVYPDRGDALVENIFGEQYIIDCFKLAMVRYNLVNNDTMG